MNKKSRQQEVMISTLVKRFDAWKCMAYMLAFVFALSLMLGATGVYAADPSGGTSSVVTFTNDTAKFYGAEIAGADSIDWYSFTAVAKDSIDIALTNNTANFNAKIVIYNANDQVVLSADAGLGGENESISGAVLEVAGTYYIGIGLSSNSSLGRPAGFTTGAYDLDISKKASATGDANEINDTVAAATALSFTANQATASGMVGSLIDVDYFSLSASKTASLRDSITVTLDASSALKATLTLYDSAGTAVSSQAAAAAGEDLTIAKFMAAYTGTYYIGVAGASSLGSYMLTVDKVSVAVVNYPPMASFTITPSTGYNAITNFAFNASGSSDNDDAITALTFSWDFDGDGTYDISDTTEATAAHIYADSGTYWVKLMVKDTGDSTAVDSMMLAVRDATSNTAPTAAATVTPTSGPVTTAFAFSAANSTDAEDVVSDLLFSWDFDSDGTYEIMDSSSTSATYTYGDTGMYTAKLKVVDTGGLMDSTTVSVTVQATVTNTAPVAAFSVSPSIGAVGLTGFWVDASASTDAEDAASALMVRWDWNNDGTYDTDYSTTKYASHVYTDTGMYTIKLQVKDTGDLTSTATQTVQVIRIIAGQKYTLTVPSDTGRVEFGYGHSSIEIKFESGNNAGKTVDFIAYDVPLPDSLGIVEAAPDSKVGAYYSISSDSIETFTAIITMGYDDSLVAAMAAAGILEDGFVVAQYSEADTMWLKVPTTVDAANNEITSSVIDQFGLWALSDIITTDVAEGPVAGIPTSFELAQNFPNPFNPTTKINFNMPKTGLVNLVIYNILGQKIRTLINEVQPAGAHSLIWDGTNDFGVKMSSGVYIYRMETAEFVSARKMMLIK